MHLGKANFPTVRGLKGYFRIIVDENIPGSDLYPKTTTRIDCRVLL